jgi:hypothetical protein
MYANVLKLRRCEFSRKFAFAFPASPAKQPLKVLLIVLHLLGAEICKYLKLVVGFAA